MDDEIVSVLQQAKERIARGWCRFELWNPVRTQFCARGAVIDSIGGRTAAHYQPHLVGPADRALAATRACRGRACALEEDQLAVINHNNICVENQTEMLDWFDRAIRWAKEQP